MSLFCALTYLEKKKKEGEQIEFQEMNQLA
jgi:hypothetical protein